MTAIWFCGGEWVTSSSQQSQIFVLYLGFGEGNGAIVKALSIKVVAVGEICWNQGDGSRFPLTILTLLTVLVPLVSFISRELHTADLGNFATDSRKQKVDWRERLALHLFKSPFTKEIMGRKVQSSRLLGLNLVRRVPKKGFPLKDDDEPPKIKKPSQTHGMAMGKTKGSVPNFILKKPNLFNSDDGGERPSKLRINLNISLKMGNGRVKDTFSDISLLRKLEPVSANKVTENRRENYSNVNAKVDSSESDIRKERAHPEFVAFALLEMLKPEKGENTTGTAHRRTDLAQYTDVALRYTLEREYKSDIVGEFGNLLGAIRESVESLFRRYTENGMNEDALKAVKSGSLGILLQARVKKKKY